MILKIVLFALAANQPKMMTSSLKRRLVPPPGNRKRRGLETRSLSLRLIQQLRRCVALEIHKAGPVRSPLILHTDLDI
jgi:hypothetical protein